VDALYSAPPEGFVAARDDAVRAARERGDREFATAAARLRRPTRAAWLANLLARRRPEQLEGLLGLAGSLADAQRTLDGAALRALSSQRRKLVTAMAREAGQLARRRTSQPATGWSARSPRSWRPRSPTRSWPTRCARAA
jgi:hypothetical protein